MRLRGWLAAVALAASLTACGAASAAKIPAAPTFNAHAAEVKACRALAAWYNGNATDTLNNDPAQYAIENDSNGTPLAGPFQTWMDDMSSGNADQTLIDADNVDSICGAVGVKVLTS